MINLLLILIHGFFLLQVFSRTLGTLTTIMITKGIISIPFDGWWLALWAVIILIVVGLFILTIKYSEKIENFIMKIIDKITFGHSNRKKKLTVESGETGSEKNEEPSNNSEREETKLPTEQGDNR